MAPLSLPECRCRLVNKKSSNLNHGLDQIYYHRHLAPRIHSQCQAQSLRITHSRKRQSEVQVSILFFSSFCSLFPL